MTKLKLGKPISNWNAKDKAGRVGGGGGVQLQHKDNNVNTRITNRNTFSSESALTMPSPPYQQQHRATQM